jgi:hypothetical protein
MRELAMSCGKPVQKAGKTSGSSALLATADTKIVVILRCFCEIFHKHVTLTRLFMHSFSHSQNCFSLSGKTALSASSPTPTTNTAIYLNKFINIINQLSREGGCQYIGGSPT